MKFVLPETDGSKNWQVPFPQNIKKIPLVSDITIMFLVRYNASLLN